MSRVAFISKLAGETKTYTFDFTSFLSSSETISTQTVTATTYSGSDSSPNAIISGAASASGAIVSQKVTAGTVGVIYLLLCTITTSLSQTLELSGFLPIIQDQG